MARRKNQPEAIKAKYLLSERILEIRTELHGERGGSEMARKLGLPVRTWYNYECGVTMPAEVLLRFMEVTGVESMWLLHGTGPKFRDQSVHLQIEPEGSIRDLLRTAIRRLESRTRTRELFHQDGHPGDHDGSIPDGHALTARGSGIHDGHPGAQNGSDSMPDGHALIRIEGHDREPLTDSDGPPFAAARREWSAAARDFRCVRVTDNAMIPILAEGAQVAFSEVEEPYQDLSGSLVVAWIEERPVARWFEVSNRFGVLRAEDLEAEPNSILLELDEGPELPKIRRVVWISTPHS